MVQVKSVKFNFIMNIILTGSSFIFPLITFPYISRILLPDGVGKVNFATSVAYYFTTFAMLGVPTYGIRACAQVRDDKEELSRTVHEILIINLIVGLISYIVYFFAVWRIPRLSSDLNLFYVMSVTIFLNIVGVEWLYKGLEQYSYITIRSIGFKVIGLLLMFLFVRKQSDYVIYGAISIVSSVGSNLLNFYNLRKYIYLRPLGCYYIRRHWKPIAVFFLMSVATTIYTNLDTVMLGFMANDTEVGYYTAAVKVKNILISFVTALSAVLLPRVTYYVEHGMLGEFWNMTRKSLSFIMVAAIPLVVYFTAFSEESILLLSGEAFVGASTPMKILMPTIWLIGITNVLGMQVLVPLGKEKKVFYSVLAGAIVDLIINMALIPEYASSGAAIGTLIAEIAVFIVQIIVLKKEIRLFIREIHIWKAMVGVACGFLISYWIKGIGFSALPVLIISSCLFFGGYGILLLILKEEFVWGMIGSIKCKIKSKE